MNDKLGRKKNSLKAVAFDLYGTLVVEKSSWLTVHNHFGTAAKAAENLKAYENGQIDYNEFMRLDISHWPKKTHIQEIDKALSNYTLRAGAKKTLFEIKKRGYISIIVSAGIDLLADKVAKKSGVDHYVANGLEIDDSGYLTGRGIYRVDLIRKELALLRVLKDLGVRPQECMALGDSKYDVGLITSVGIGVAFGEDECLSQIASISIRRLTDLFSLL